MYFTALAVRINFFYKIQSLGGYERLGASKTEPCYHTIRSTTPLLTAFERLGSPNKCPTVSERSYFE